MWSDLKSVRLVIKSTAGPQVSFQLLVCLPQENVNAAKKKQAVLSLFLALLYILLETSPREMAK